MAGRASGMIGVCGRASGAISGGGAVSSAGGATAGMTSWMAGKGALVSKRRGFGSRTGEGADGPSWAALATLATMQKRKT